MRTFFKMFEILVCNRKTWSCKSKIQRVLGFYSICLSYSRMMPGTMPLRGPQGQVGGPRAGTSMRGGPMGRGDYGKYFLQKINDFSEIYRKVLVCLLVK